MSRWLTVLVLSAAGVGLSTQDAAAFGGRLFKKKGCDTGCPMPCLPACYTPCAVPCALP